MVTEVEPIRFAALGDPVELKVRGYNLALRKHEWENIQGCIPNPYVVRNYSNAALSLKNRLSPGAGNVTS